MFDPMYAVILIGAGLIAIAVLTSVIAFRLGAPLLLVFLGLGLIAGEDGLGLRFDDAYLAYYVGSLALAVILFDSGFGTRYAAFRIAATPAIVLATVGVLLTAALTGAAAHYIFGLPWLQSFLIGAIISSTDAAVVFFLLRVGGITILERIRSTLEVESGSNDPMAIFLTLTVVELIVVANGSESFGMQLLLGFAQQMGLGLLLGLVGGFLIVRIVNAIRLEPGLYPIMVLAASLLIFAVVGRLGGSGFLAVYVAGLYAGNQNIKYVVSLRRFQDGLTWLAQIVMFLVLGLLATPSQFPSIAIPTVALGMFLMVVARPVAAWLCLLPFQYRPNETAFISWVGLRGAVSILLAILPMLVGIPNGQMIFNIAFILVLTSLLVQGWTIAPTARWLGLIVPSQIGPIEKFELELPGAAHHELVAYRVVPDSPVARGERIPGWARPSLVIRDGRSMRFQYAGRIQADDYVYLFVTPRYMRLMDRLFASPAIVKSDDRDFFGDFVIDPSKSVKDVGQAYDFAVDESHSDQTVEDFIKARLGGAVELGDRVSCGDVELVVREMGEDGKIVRAGIVVDPGVSQSAKIPLFLNARRILDRFRKWWRDFE
jgi:potassium/hydrogen antiporter